MREKPCEEYEGCQGLGYHYDAEDSGSGRTVYCDCPIGIELRLEETGEEEIYDNPRYDSSAHLED